MYSLAISFFTRQAADYQVFEKFSVVFVFKSTTVNDSPFVFMSEDAIHKKSFLPVQTLQPIEYCLRTVKALAQRVLYYTFVVRMYFMFVASRLSCNPSTLKYNCCTTLSGAFNLQHKAYTIQL